MLITVITVCLNTEKLIGPTIASVLAQEADFYEYLVVDGASTDRTLAIAESFRPAFEARGIRYTIVSERDAGIYDAMNKAARLASGEWLLYMNAGDRLIGPEVMAKFRQPLSEGDAQIVYGSTVMLRGGKMLDSPPLPLEKMMRKQAVCHQSTFIRSALLRQRPYVEHYKGAGDYDFFLWAYRHGVKFQRVDEYVALFRVNGFSEAHPYVMERERLKVRLAHGAIRKRYYLRWMALLALEEFAGGALMTKAAKRRREARRGANQQGWVKSAYDEI